MKLTPSSTTRRSVAMACSRLDGSPQTPEPVIRIAPNPSLFTVRSPPMSIVPAAAAVGCAFTPVPPHRQTPASHAPPSPPQAPPHRPDESGTDLGPGDGELDRRGQRLDVVSAVVPHAVDKEGGRARYPGQVG